MMSDDVVQGLMRSVLEGLEGIKAEVGGIKAEMEGIKAEVGGIKAEMNEKFENLEAAVLVAHELSMEHHGRTHEMAAWPRLQSKFGVRAAGSFRTKDLYGLVRAVLPKGETLKGEKGNGSSIIHSLDSARAVAVAKSLLEVSFLRCCCSILEELLTKPEPWTKGRKNELRAILERIKETLVNKDFRENPELLAEDATGFSIGLVCLRALLPGDISDTQKAVEDAVSLGDFYLSKGVMPVLREFELDVRGDMHTSATALSAWFGEIKSARVSIGGLSGSDGRAQEPGRAAKRRHLKENARKALRRQTEKGAAQLFQRAHVASTVVAMRCPEVRYQLKSALMLTADGEKAMNNTWKELAEERKKRVGQNLNHELSIECWPQQW